MLFIAKVLFDGTGTALRNTLVFHLNACCATVAGNHGRSKYAAHHDGRTCIERKRHRDSREIFSS